MIELPQDFTNRILKQRKDADEFLDALNTESPISIRLNPKKLISRFDDNLTVPWCAQGRYLKTRPLFTKDPLFHAGAFYPQEAGSMFVDAILKQLDLPKALVALDLCAAPGGKSTILLDNISESSLLISNEIVRNRAYILRDNLTRWGKANVLVTNKSATDFGALGALFDLVLVDAPCSGEGMFRKDQNARTEWSLKNAETCVHRQKDILDDIWPSIKQGGYLIYSTCTFNPSENEDQILRFLKDNECELFPMQFPASYNLEPIEKQSYGTLGYVCLPHNMQTEGFFFSVLRKTASSPTVQLKIKKDNKKSKTPVVELPLFQSVENHEIAFVNDAFYMVPTLQAPLMHFIQSELSCMKFGVKLGELLGNKWIPHFEYALSFFDKSQFDVCKLSSDNALSYLKGNTFELEGKDGWHLMQYQDHALGWMKKIGRRSNNYYPKELRIKMEI